MCPPYFKRSQRGRCMREGFGERREDFRSLLQKAKEREQTGGVESDKCRGSRYKREDHPCGNQMLKGRITKKKMEPQQSKGKSHP